MFAICTPNEAQVPDLNQLQINVEDQASIASVHQLMKKKFNIAENEVNSFVLSSKDPNRSLLDKFISDNKSSPETIEKLINDIKQYEKSILDYGSYFQERNTVRSIWDMALNPIHTQSRPKTMVRLINSLLTLNANVNICSFSISDPQNSRETLLDKLFKKIYEDDLLKVTINNGNSEYEIFRSLARKIILEDGAISVKILNENEKEIYNSLIRNLQSKNSNSTLGYEEALQIPDKFN